MKRILMVDDEEDLCRFTKANLETIGDFEVSVCCDGTEAVGQAKELRPDLILLDIMMPKMDGPQIAAELKTIGDTKDIPVVFLTALIRKEEIGDGLGIMGGNYFVSKPVRISKLVGVINKLLA